MTQTTSTSTIRGTIENSIGHIPTGYAFYVDQAVQALQVRENEIRRALSRAGIDLGASADQVETVLNQAFGFEVGEVQHSDGQVDDTLDPVTDAVPYIWQTMQETTVKSDENRIVDALGEVKNSLDNAAELLSEYLRNR